uniref:Uncharacterized protein n=1 Tax=Salmonella phage vB_Si_CECAV_FGS009 TaxID=3126494 RepID=A0AAU6PXM8_9CAUD
MPHFANKILLFLHLSQINPNLLNSSPKSPQIRCSAPNMRPSRSSPQISPTLSSSPQTHTITHPLIEVTKILSDSHILILEKPCRICTYPTGFERSS